MAKVKRGFILSYQANAHLYEKLDVKRKIVTALVKSDAKKLKSFTDSTIYFELLAEEKDSITDGKAIVSAAFRIEKISLQYTLGSFRTLNETSFSFDYVNGDQNLNTHFIVMVQEVRKKENKPE